MKQIKKGSSGVDVRAARLLLGASDASSFDSDFDATVKAFQTSAKLTADGIIGQKTWAVIASKAPTVKNSKSDKAATKALQAMLGMSESNIDGICGTKTKAQIMAYQAASGLTADGACGNKTWSKILGVSASAAPTTDKPNAQCRHYIQWDSRWKNVKYSTHTSSQTIGNSGCGTTAMAMILSYWIDSSITPVTTSRLSVDNGYRTYSSGTAWGFFQFCFKKYGGFSKFVQTSSITTLQAALEDGALAVCSMNSGDSGFWTKSGHFITAIKTDGTYIFANDPNKSAHPRKQAITKFKTCMKQAFIFWP